MDNLQPFSMSCSVRRDCLETGECVIIVHCTSQFEIVPDSTTCVVDDDPPFQCKYNNIILRKQMRRILLLCLT